ncbi:hypothetical protein F5B19DRAFT_175394 [Rostrohypoxylon terebratum]|nr:hypothetical protein F5B19DRAFT_175394 [Rostrohypoxylon terebratum]
MDPKLKPRDVSKELLKGAYAFYEYAVACWVPHLLAWLPHAKPEEIEDLRETLDTFLDVHYTEPKMGLPVSISFEDKLRNLESLDIYDSLVQCILSTQNLLKANKREEPSHMTDFPEITTMIRSSLEDMSRPSPSTETKAKLDKYYGTGWFKCPRIYCQHFYNGFEKPDDRDIHVNRHDRPYMCIVDGCPTATFGCVSKVGLEKHMLEYHGIHNDTQQFPDQSHSQDHDTRKQDGGFKCTICTKHFTNRPFLERHERSHESSDGPKCTVCGKSFSRIYDRNRHERIHGEKEFVCHGYPVQWGCGKRFARDDALKEHLMSKLGFSCLKALAEENLEVTQAGLVDMAHREIQEIVRKQRER